MKLLLLATGLSLLAAGRGNSAQEFLHDATPASHFRSRGELVNLVDEGVIVFDMALNPLLNDLHRAYANIKRLDTYVKDLGQFRDSNGTKPWQARTVRPTLSAALTDCKEAIYRLRTIYDTLGILFPSSTNDPQPKEAKRKSNRRNKPRRQPRQALAVLAGTSIGWVTSKILGLFSGSSLNPEQSIRDLESNEHAIAASLTQQEHETNKHFRELEHVEDLLSKELDFFLQASRWSEAAQLCVTSTRTVTAHVTRVSLGVLQLVAFQQLPASLIAPYYLHTKLDHLARQAKINNMQPLPASPAELLGAHTDYVVFPNATIRGIVRVPLFPHKQVFSLYEFIPTPMKVDSNITGLVQIKPPKPFLAVYQDQETLFFTMSSTSTCPLFRNRVRTCHDHPVLRKRRAPDCTFSLFSSDTNGVLNTCPIHALPRLPDIWTIRPDHYLLYHPDESALTISCQNKPSDTIFTTSFSGLKRLSLPPRCRAFTDVSTLTHFPTLLREQLVLNVSATNIADVLPSIADPVQLRGFNGNGSDFSPFVYHDPAMRPVRHPEELSQVTHILAIFGPIALLGLILLVLILFCKYKQRVQQIYYGLPFVANVRERGSVFNQNNQQELQPMRTDNQAPPASAPVYPNVNSVA